MLKVITYNCQCLKNSLHDVNKLCQYYDYIFLQETTGLFNLNYICYPQLIKILKDLA